MHFRRRRTINIFVTEINGQMALLKQDGKEKILTHQYFVIGLRPEIKIGKPGSILITFGLNASRPAQITNRSLKRIFQEKGYSFQASPYASIGLQMAFK